MNSLPDVSEYSALEISKAVAFSSVLNQYLQLTFSSEFQYHQNRTQIWIQASLATLTAKAPSSKVCYEWSLLAKRILQDVFQECFSDSQVALFALGKLGSEELNLSSDVDLVLISEEEGSLHLKALRQFQKILSERTSKGFLFRVDFDLRPGGRQGPLIPTLDQFIDYYGNYGETWERLAFVRLSPIAGSQNVIKSVQEFAKKFTYRKHLDYTLLDDLKNLRGKIRQHYADTDPKTSWDLKLGLGGIRDIELFTHALQVIHGGKNPQLQIASTTGALDMLAATNILPLADVEFLKAHYWRLRQLENFVQSLNDEQTHILSRQQALPEWGEPLVQRLDQDLLHCNQIVQTLLGEATSSAVMPANSAPEVQSVWDEILQMSVLSRNKDRDENARLQFLDQFLATLQKQNGNVPKALQHLKDFIHSTRAKASFFTLLVRNPSLMEELAWLFGHSPYLSQILCSRPELIDSYVYRSQELQTDDLSVLLEQMVEKRLLGELINGSHYLEDRNLEVLQANVTTTADEIAKTLLKVLKEEHPSDLQVLALGKWGGKELGFRSDLDFIFVTPGEPQEVDGKLARRFINRLSEARKGGSIFAIDMRLKPSGKAGPFVISIKQLEEYLQNDAQAWERQAYLKARWISETPFGLNADFKTKGLQESEIQELERIRKGLIRTDSETLDLKYAEGGLLDIELFAQTYLLKETLPPTDTSTLHFLSLIAPARTLADNYSQLRQIEQMSRLVLSESSSKLQINHESFQQLAMALQFTPEELHNHVKALFYENLHILNALDPRRRVTILNRS